MIVKITHGDRFSGMMVYLVGPGREDEHTEPHVLAGDPGLVAMYGYDELDRGAALALARDLDLDRRRTGTEVVKRGKRWDEAAGEYVTTGTGGAHVWQCSLSLHPDEAALSDERWAAIAHDFMARMGFDDPKDPREPARWVAVRHGLSGGGNDHIHLVANVVRADGTKVSGYKDYRLASAVAAELERKHGLRVVEGRGAFRSNEPGFSQGEDLAQRRHRRAAGHAGRDARDPDRLVRHGVHRKVRAAAAAAGTEAEFVRRLRRSGLNVRPRFAQGTTDVVVGYSVRQKAVGDQDASRWFAGGHLARDLTLTQLREQHGWSSTPQDATEAAAEWRAARRGTRPANPEGRETRPARDEDWQEWYARTDELLRRLAAGEADPPTWAAAAREASGALAAWSVREEGMAPGPLGHAARTLARSAWYRDTEPPPASPAPAGQVLGNVAVLLAAAKPSQKSRVLDAALLAQVMRLAQAVHAAHQQASRTSEALRIAQTTRADLTEIRRNLPRVRTRADAEEALARLDAAERSGRRPPPAVPVDGDRLAPRPRSTPQQEHQKGQTR